MNTSDHKSDAAKREEDVLAFWGEHSIFQKSLDKKSPRGEFVFYEGPPTANAPPALHHLESRAFKDVIPRYKTMRGYHVRRRAGWDTHGLPVELQIEKELGFSGKPDIEKYGVEAFNEKCRESVYTYINEWEKFTERIGYWVDRSNAYYTLDAPYMESLWHIFKHINDDGRLVKDYKVLPWCTRCGTALSSHELAQGYEEVKDLSLTAKFRLLHPEEVGEQQPTFILAWTTTPWTLPGNVALAVGNDIEYVKIRGEEETLIVARERAEALDLDATGAETVHGKVLVGQQYEPLYRIKDVEKHDGKKWQVVSADFVSTEDGTGIVHTAVMYGEDDFELGKKENLPKVHTVNAQGEFTADIDFLKGRYVRDEAVSVDILKDLTARGLFFAKEKYEHTYPFCWRCKSPLIYYARDSWYFRMTDLREKMATENNKINWEPSHIKTGRFGEWIGNAKDWAISRERYWGTPLPVWESEDGSERLVVGSLDDVKNHTKKSGNEYFVMRHGQAQSNAGNFVSATNSTENKLTELGIAQVQKTAASFEKPDIIISSPIMRARETAELMAEALQYSKEDIVVDERIKEIDPGELDGKPNSEFHEFFGCNYKTMFTKIPKGGENLSGMRQRVGEFIYDIESKYENKKILIVTHEYVTWLLDAVAGGLQIDDVIKLKENRPEYYETGELRPFTFVPIPHNRDYELDFHRPYIDEVTLVSNKDTELTRTKEVMDVWFDSGSMPLAQDHYPFENKAWIDGPGYPADFISEAIDQTRGWFYTLLAIGVLTGRGTPYKNVICLGHLLDGEGKKMSKSKGNIINPWDAINQWGVDTLRFWMFSVNAPGDSKSFEEKTVREAARTLSWLENSMRFYELFKGVEKKSVEEQVIDTWMRARVEETVTTMTDALDRYDITVATRALADLFEDVSQWYVRRVRDRVRDGDRAAVETLRYTLGTCARLLAPFAPFMAETVYREVKTDSDPESVHLADWPTAESGGFFAQLFGTKLESDVLVRMKSTRAIISEALKVRQVSGIKVRQPLAMLTVKDETLKGNDAYLTLIRDEVNVKEVAFDSSLEEEVMLDTTITPELKEEGDVRELIRTIQDLRKETALSPHDEAILVFAGDSTLLQKHWAQIREATNLVRFEAASGDTETHVKKS